MAAYAIESYADPEACNIDGKKWETWPTAARIPRMCNRVATSSRMAKAREYTLARKGALIWCSPHINHPRCDDIPNAAALSSRSNGEGVFGVEGWSTLALLNDCEPSETSIELAELEQDSRHGVMKWHRPADDQQSVLLRKCFPLVWICDKTTACKILVSIQLHHMQGPIR